MRMVKCLCLAALCMPLMVSTVGCGEEEAGAVATDAELIEYGKNAAKDSAFGKAFDAAQANQNK